MSEYAIRKADGKEIYIGSCETMSELRYEDRDKVISTYKEFDIQTCLNLYWRLPVPDEDAFLPGEYKQCAYYRKDLKYDFYYISTYCLLENNSEYFAELEKFPGSFQYQQAPLGLLLNIKCYHGLKINESNSDVGFGWNGKKSPLCLSGVKNEGGELKILIECVSCNKIWSQPFQDIQHLIKNEELKKRLFKLCSQYWEERNLGEDYPYAMTRKTDNGKATISLRRWTNAFRDKYAVSIEVVDDGQTNYYWTLEDAFTDYMKY